MPDIEKFKGFDIGHDKLGAFKYIQSDPVLMKGITGFHKDFVKVQDTVVNHIQSTRFHQTAGEKLGGVGAKILSSGQPNADENARIATLFERHVRSSGTIEFAAVKKADF